MFPVENERLKQQYTDQYVAIAVERPELARFAGLVGQVKTVNQNGRALVQFDGFANRGWYDIELGNLRIVDKPEPKPAPKPAAPAVAAKPAKPVAQPEAAADQPGPGAP